MGRENPSQRLLYSRCVIRATTANFCFRAILLPRSRQALPIFWRVRFRAKTFDGGIVRTEGRPRHDSRGFLFGTFLTSFGWAGSAAEHSNPRPSPKFCRAVSHAP